MARSDVTAEGAQPVYRLGTRRRRWGEDGIKVLLLLLCAAISIATTVGIVVALLIPSIEFFQQVNFGDFITGTRWAPLFEPPDFGVLPLISGTIAVTIWAMVVFIPLGIGVAIYLSEYARPQVRKWVKPILEILAGIPTVVFGYFALVFFTPLLQDVGIPVGPFSALSAGLVVGLLLIPTVASISEDAMSSVPQDLRAGAYALGAAKFKVATRIVVPAAFSGIVASIILAISRAVGETMIVYIAAGGQPNLSFNPTEAVQTMTAFIGAAGLGDVPTGSIEYKTIFAVGLTLFVLTLLMNMASIWLVRRFREEYD